ncbi:MAG: MFS transporter [Bacteriovoracaceae bacterium]|nr:MFS transporter [Bacteriovoracaceae bacterium]
MGSFITETALMLFVFNLSGENKAYLGITRASFLLCLTIGSIVGGPIGQRFNRKTVLIVSNVFRIPLILCLIFSDNIFLVITINSLVALFTGIYNPSRQALINDIVPHEHINTANSVTSSSMAFLHLVGPFVGAWAYAYFSGIKEVLSFDLITYFIGILLLTSTRYSPPKTHEEGENLSFLGEIADGIKLVRSRLDLISLYLNCILGGLCIGILVPLLLPFVTEVLGKDEKAYGIVLSCFGLGGFAGGILSAKFSKLISPGRLIVVSICLESIMMNIWVRVHDYHYNLIIIFFWGMVVFTRLPSQLNYISKTVETKYLTRTHSLLDLSFVVPNITGGVIVALIGNYYPTTDILKVVAAFFVLFIIPRVFFKEMKSLYNSTAKSVSRDQNSFDQLG